MFEVFNPKGVERTKKTLKTGISPEYVKGWTVEKAVREILQNYLDSRKEFNCKGKVEWKDGMGIAKDNGPGLELKHLALGVSEKGSKTIGKYGEGLKLALLVMAREGRQVEIWTRGMIISPEIRFDENYQTDIMVLNIKHLPKGSGHKGTTIKFACSKKELEAGKSYFLHFITHSPNNEFTWVEKDRISWPGGHIYVNGARVGTIPNALFSYHLEEEMVGDIGNRDREVVDRDAVERAVRQILARSRASKVADEILRAVIQQERDIWEVWVGVYPWMLSKKTQTQWRRSLNRIINVSKVVLNDGLENDVQAKYKGYQVLELSDSRSRELMKGLGIQTSLQVNREGGQKKKAAEKVLLRDLTELERENLRKARKVISRFYAAPGKITIMESLLDWAGVTDSRRVDGFYSGREDRIYLRRGILTNLKQTVHVLLHETVHKKTKTEDITEEFERALCDAAVAILIATNKVKP